MTVPYPTPLAGACVSHSSRVAVHLAVREVPCFVCGDRAAVVVLDGRADRALPSEYPLCGAHAGNEQWDDDAEVVRKRSADIAEEIL